MFLKFLIERAVPILNFFRQAPYWTHSMDDLRILPQKSVGRDLAFFIDNQNLMLLPKYEVHDVLHVILGYGTTPIEEMKLQGFMIGNRSSTFGGKVLFVLGLVIKPEYWKQVKKELKRGRHAAIIRGIDFNNLVHVKTEELRINLNIA